MPTTDIVGAFVNASLARAAPVLGRWLSPIEIERNLRAEVATLVHDATPPRNTPIADRAELVTVTTARGAIALLAIPRLHADSRRLPHVNIPYRTANLLSADLPAILDAMIARFGPLGVDRMCIFSHGSEPAWATNATVVVRPYKRYLAASLAEIDASPPPPNADRVAVRTPADLCFHAEYEAMYRDFWESSPHLRDVIGIETPEDLEEFLHDGGLRLVEVDGELAGLIGAVRRIEHGMRGWRLRERVMSKRFRGGGFATAALWRFAHDVRRDPGDLIWGTIMHENQPSMRSALGVGRVDVGGLVWVERGTPSGAMLS